MSYRVLVVDDDIAIQSAIKLALKSEAMQLQFASSPKEALQKIEADTMPDLLLLDLHFPQSSGLDLLRSLNQKNIQIPCLLISGAATAKEAVEGIKLGAFDYIEKPLSAERLRLSIERCLKHHHQWLVLNSLTRQTHGPHSLIGFSTSIQEVKNLIARYAASDVRVLITGETGTGKEVVAQSIVHNSLRAGKTFLVINAAAIPESLLESELFGHRRGSFTGAIADRIGKIEMAHEGTLFLDEIGDLSLSAQAKLLRFLETGEIQRVGDLSIRKVDVRVIAATSRNLEKMMATGEFRSDLYYRLNVARIPLSPLRERTMDIVPLFKYFVSHFQERLARSPQSSFSLSMETIQLIEKYSWPGNIRELRSFAERCCFEGKRFLDQKEVRILLHAQGKDTPISLLDDASIILSKTTAPDQNHNPSPFQNLHQDQKFPSALSADKILPLKAFKHRMEKEYIEKVLAVFDGNISRAAAKLEMDRSHLHQKISQWRANE